MIAPTSVGIPSSGSTLVSGITMYSANAPSRSTPMMRVFLQMWLLPVRHCRQWPQTICPSAVTSWPALSSVTPSPHDSISPANSWPTTTGGLMRPCAQGSQSAMCRSVPQTPACRTAISTSPGPGVGFGTDFTVKPGARFSLTIACMDTRDAGSEMRDALEDGSSETAINLKYGAGNIAGRFGRKERHGGCQLARVADAAHRDLGPHLLHHLGLRLRQLFDPLGRDEPGTNTVHGDAVTRHLVGERLRESQNAGTRCRGENQSRQRLFGSHRYQADDAAPLGLLHDRDGRASQMNRRQQVQLDRPMPGVRGLIFERSSGRAARIAKQDIEAAKLLGDTMHKRCGLLGVRYIGRERRVAASVDRDL